MWQILGQYTIGMTNYEIINVPNHYNCYFNILEDAVDDDARKKILQNIKINIGKSFYNKFKMYIYEKVDREHSLIKLL